MGKRAKCTSNLRQIALATALYADDNENILPHTFELKKQSLPPNELADGKLLNTLTNGIQTELAAYASEALFACPSDSGDHQSRTPIWERRGSSYHFHGYEPKDDSNPEKADKKLQRLDPTQLIAHDVFRPWDSDDRLKVLQAVAKGEHGPVKWHRRFYGKAMGDGHVIYVNSKAEDKESEGKTGDD
jgi:hypothetical protein